MLSRLTQSIWRRTTTSTTSTTTTLIKVPHIKKFTMGSSSASSSSHPIMDASNNTITSMNKPMQSTTMHTSSTSPSSTTHNSSTLLASSSPSSSSSPLRWLVLFGSSLLIAEVARHSIDSSSSGDQQHVYAATAPEASSASSFVSDVWNPAPIGRYDEWITNWDGLESIPHAIDPKSGRPIHVTRHLIFIRHGQYVLPKSDDDDDIDPILTELGRHQARITGKRLLSLYPKLDAIHCSTMSRAYETASLIGESYPHLTIQSNDLLREGVPCMHLPQHPTWRPSESTKREEPKRIDGAFRRYVKRWREDSEGRQIHGEEVNESEKKSSSTNSKLNHVDAKTTISTTTSDGFKSSSSGTIALSSSSSASSLPPIRLERYELIVCHGNVIRYALLRALQFPVQGWLRLAIYNTGMSHMTIHHDGGVTLRSMGDTGHLTKEEITYH